MICEKCGKENAEGMKFCEDCGAPLGAQNIPSVNDIKEMVMENKEKAIGLAAIVVIVIAIICLLSGGGYKKPIKNMIKAANTGKVTYALKSMPKQVQKEYKDDDDMLERIEENLENSKKADKKEFGDNVKYSVEILDKIKIEKEDLEDVEDEFGEQFEEAEYVEDADDVKVTKGYKVAVKQVTKGKKKKEVDYDTVYVYKVNGKWCTFDF